MATAKRAPATKEELEQAKLQAEIRKLNAEADYADQQAIAQAADAVMARVLADSAGIALSKEMRRKDWEQASDSFNRVYQFVSSVGENSVDAAVDTLNRWHRIDTENGNLERSYKFVISSPGGSVIHGMKLHSTLKNIAQKRPVITIGSGLVASMATVIMQAGSTRLIEPGTSFLLHDISGDAWGSLGSVKDTLNWMEMLNHELHKILSERSNMTVEEIETLSKRTDAWMLADEVIERGFADGFGYAL